MNKAISDSDVTQVLIQTLAFENANTECKRVIRPYVRTLLEVPYIKMPCVSIVGYMLICKKTVTNLLKVSDLKMPSALIVENMVKKM